MNNMSEPSDASLIICNEIINLKLFNKGDRVVVGVSGGADSLCVMHALDKIKDLIEFKIFVAHLNHKLRGEQADKDETYVKGLCENFKITCFCKSVDVKAIARDAKISLEQAGRKARYEYFKELCNEYQLNKIVTAHNKNDQAETVLLRILRGTGIDGLSGIKKIRDDNVVRPLLRIARKTIDEYCQNNHLVAAVDLTNADTSYTRNKIRHELIPFIEAKFNPSVVESLAKLAENVSEDVTFLENYAARVYKRLKMNTSVGISLHIKSFFLLQKSLQVRLIRLAANEAVEKTCPLEKKHFTDIIKLAENHKNGTMLDSASCLGVSIKKGWLVFYKRG